VSIVTASAVTVGVAAHLAGEFLVNPPLARAGGAVALLALASYAVTAAPRVRWPLVGGLLVFAVAAASALVWDELGQRSLPPADCVECFRGRLAHPDLAAAQWGAALALVGTVAVAVAVALSPSRALSAADRAGGDPRRVTSASVGIAVVVALAAVEVALFGLALRHRPLAVLG